MNRRMFASLIKLIAAASAFAAALTMSVPITSAQPASAPIPGPTLTINASAPVHLISPLIYGMNWAEASLLTEFDLPANRFGGNHVSRYNYQNDVSNHAMDWYYENVKESTANNMPDDSYANRFIEANNAAGTDTILTVPMMGYVSNSNYGLTGCSFRISVYGAQTDNDWEHRPDCGNGIAAGGAPITGNNPADTSIAITQAFVQGWVNYLEGRYGAANTANGVRFYALDNEPDLWYETHRDVHPEGATYQELFTRGRDYAAAIKAADPTAQVLGPVAWGWTGYIYSSWDYKRDCYGSCWDRAANGDVPFLEWYLTQMQNYHNVNGTRILDYLDIHFYTQAGFYNASGGVTLNSAGDATRQAMRLRSTRSLWDPTYHEVDDDSWIDTYELEGVMLIPRMREIIDNNYPGTKLAITEYNWGALNHINGALAQADVLGIFGREGVDMATIWDYCAPNLPPCPTQPGTYAFRMYLNYDGEGGDFGNVSLQSSSTNHEEMSVFGSKDSMTGEMKIMIINKTANEYSSAVNISGFCAASTATVYRYSSANLNAIVLVTSSLPVASSGFTTTYPANSITLVVIPPGYCSPFSDVPEAGKEWMATWIERFYQAGITGGCANPPLQYCPERPVTRAEMAVFLMRAIKYPPLPYTPTDPDDHFDDVPVAGKAWMQPWIEEFYDLGITQGCAVNPLRFCPEQNVTRAEMAVFILRALEGGSYVPPPASGYFDDVPVEGKAWMEAWIDEFYRRGITGGCANPPLQFCPEREVTRAEMAVFILRAFDSLPDPP